MLPCSVRRVASAAPQSPLLSTLSAAVPRATITTGRLSLRPSSQKRYSSSKPSRDNGSQGLPVRGTVTPSAESKTTETAKPAGEKRKRKQKLPSVPSTHHISQDYLALSSFFSLHRPISVTHSIPTPITKDAFDSIFTPKTKARRALDVMQTLSNAAKEYEDPMTKLGLSGGGQQDADAADAAHKIDVRHPDGTETSVYVQVNAMSGHFLPFRPPPLPEPIPEAAAAAGAAASSSDPEAGGDLQQEDDGAGGVAGHPHPHQQPGLHTRVYKAVFTIEETTGADGQVKIMAHSPELVEAEQLLEPDPDQEHDGAEAEAAAEEEPEPEPERARVPRSFLERMALRQLRYEDARDRRGEAMRAISVRRQRKLKMKKKKYKKLLKRTRNERRKADKL